MCYNVFIYIFNYFEDHDFGIHSKHAKNWYELDILHRNLALIPYMSQKLLT